MNKNRKLSIRGIANDFVRSVVKGTWEKDRYVPDKSYIYDLGLFKTYPVAPGKNIEIQMEKDGEFSGYYCNCYLYSEETYSTDTESCLVDLTMDMEPCREYWNSDKIADSINTLMQRNCPDLLEKEESA